jgi:hypothetical protein
MLTAPAAATDDSAPGAKAFTAGLLYKSTVGFIGCFFGSEARYNHK